MTDEQIIKALECCGLMSIPCSQCPYFQTEPCVQLKSDALDLVNRQKAEIERLESEMDKQYETAEASIRAEIASGGTSCHWCEDQIKFKAIKDFAERLKEKAVDNYRESLVSMSVDMDEIDDLVKEMIGEQE